MVHMKRGMVIEWRHIGNDVSGTCDRCSRTGDAIQEVLEELQPYFREKKVTVRFRERILPDSKIEQSNQVRLNGIPLEDYLAGSRVVQTPCCSCACITGQDGTECRAIGIGDKLYESLPAELLKQVIISIVETMTTGDDACCPGCD
jgi:hypothetical protein